MSYLYLDIETIPTQNVAEIVNIANTITPPGNISKAETIAAWEAEKKPALIQEAISKTALNGALGHVCCIGWAVDGHLPETITWPGDVENEAGMIHMFKTILDAQRPMTIVGHYVAGFDIRFLWQRAIVLGIRMPAWFPRDPKPWSNEVFDTMTAWAGSRDTIGLDKLCKALGIEGKGDMDGSMVAQMWSDGRYTEIAEYCKGDVERARAVHKKMQIAYGQMAA
jgi:DNA polymerase elongation subunit (family B)